MTTAHDRTQAPSTPVRGRWFEDLAVGDEILTGGRTIGEAAVDTFAGLTGDFALVHTDSEAARATEFGQRVVQGLLTLGVLQGLIWQTGYCADTALATMSWENVAFPRPVLIGDTVRGQVRVKSLRPHRAQPGVGIVVEGCVLANQRDEPVLTADHVVLVRRRETS